MVRFWLESASTTWPPTKAKTLSTPIGQGTDSHERKSEDLEEDLTIESKQGTIATNDYSELSTIQSESREYLNQEVSVNHDPSDRIWNGALDFREIDWWSTLQVVQAAFQLVSAGWRIPPNERGEEIIAYFLDIVEKGMMLRADQLKSYRTGTDRDAREERLAASSSAMAAVSVLSAVASIGQIPYNAQPITVRTICRMQVAAMKSSESLVATLFPRGDPDSISEEVAWKADYETFLENREDCLSDISALQWVLLAHSSSAATAIASFLDMMRLSASVENAHEQTGKEASIAISSEIATVRSACIATDAVSGSLWGIPPDVPGIATLRIYWYPVLGTLGSLASWAHDRVVRIDRMWEDIEADASGRDALLHATLSLVLELIIALRRFVDEEWIRGECLLAPDEWEVFVTILEENIDKWLCITACSITFAAETTTIDEIRSEVGMLLVQLQHFLERSSQPELSLLSLAVDDVCREKLYAILLRKAVPCMQPEKGTSLALAVIRSWSATGFALHRSDEWAHTAPCIIVNAFAVFEDPAFGFYGGCVHSPLVRLEALKSVTFGEGNEEGKWEPEHFGPLARSIHIREQYLAILNRSVVPLLIKTFGPPPADRNIRVAVTVTPPMTSFSSRKQRFDMDFYGVRAQPSELSLKSSELTLRRFALSLVGRLFCSVAVERKHRTIFIEMMQSVAINETIDVIHSTLKASAESTVGIEMPRVFPAEFRTSFTAIQELERCLCLPFRALPHAHESLPAVVDALCSVIIVYAGEPERQRNVKTGTWLAMKRCLAIAAVLPLARLGSTHDKLLVLSPACDLTELVPSSLILLFDDESYKGTGRTKQQSVQGSSDTTVAPFIVVSDGAQQGDSQSSSRTHRTSTGRTLFSFSQVFSSLLLTLLTNLESKQSRDHAATGPVSEAIDCEPPVEELDSNFRAVCYEALRNFVQSGIAFPLLKELIPILNFVGSKKASDFSREDLSRCRCVATVVEFLVIKYEEIVAHSAIAASSLAVKVDSDWPTVADSLVQHLLLFCTSTDTRSILSGCRSFHSLIGFMADNFPTCGILAFETLLGSLKLAVTNMQHGAAVFKHNGVSYDELLDVTEALVSVLYDIMCALSEHGGNLPCDMIFQTFDVCIELCMSHRSRRTELCRLLCVRLIAVLLNNLSMDDANTSASENVKARLINLLPIETLEIGDLQTDSMRDNEVNQSKVLGDVIAQKLLSVQRVHSDTSSTSTLGGSSLLTYHELLAKETDDISRFIVETANSDLEAPSAAWLCGQSTLLTCRVGSQRSRYRGWLEVMIRSPTSRIRRLVRLPSANSLDSPELPSSLWCDPSTQLPPGKSIQTIVADMQNRFIDDSSEIKKASLLIEKFDALFYPLILLPRDEGPKNSLVDHGLTSQEMNAAVRSGGSSQENTAPSLGSPKASDKETGSVKEWLGLVLKDPSKMGCVVDELCKLGFTQAALGSSQVQVDARFDALTEYFLPMVRLSDGPKVDRALSILNRTPPINTHKIALLFATDAKEHDTPEGLSLEDTVLSSTSGSPQFLTFVEGLGKLVLTRHLKYYSGGLDTSGCDSDGKLAVIWLDRDDRFARSMVVFHVVPLMPAGSNNRKKHVGNDNVHIVYVDPTCMLDRNLHRVSSNENVTSNIVSGEFGFVIIFVEILSRPTHVRVSIRLRDCLSKDMKSRLDHVVADHVVSKAAAPTVIRQLATRADIACRTITEDQFGKQNWEERQRQIAAMRRYVVSTEMNYQHELRSIAHV